MSNLVLIGRSEKVDIPHLNALQVHARIDTGAKTSSIWATKIVREGDTLKVVFFGEGSPYYTGEPVEFSTFGETVVASSNGHAEHRYKVRILTVMHGKRIRATYTLANRGSQAYPVLIGRNVLRNKFVVDVSIGDIPHDLERQRSQQLRTLIGGKEDIKQP
jgi:hypothetical protein